MHTYAVVLLALLGPASALTSDVTSGGNPISRIVTLLNGLKDKLEEDLKAETDLYETYVCWYKTTTSTKTASNEAAGSRIDSLKTYIKDIDAGKIEFTSERVDLEKQVAGLNKDLETAQTLRENEHKDFLAAQTEMKQGIAALDKAIAEIEGATKDSLAQTRSYVDLLSTRHSLQKSLVFARAFLDAEDQKYLEELLDNAEPKDYKKLNRKADHKMKYKASSGKILETLKKLRTQFKSNLDDAQKQEKEAEEQYQTLKKSKGGMLDKAEKALTDMSLENGARGVSKEEAQNEVDALEEQVKADTKFIAEAEEAFKTKEKEWEARKELRSKEVLAMSQAIAVLASDDAKDQFGKSFKSQGYLFLQEFQSEPQRRKCAARLVRTLASQSSDPQLGQLALLAVQTGNEAIKKVIVKIDDIIAQKKKEEKEDLDKKEKCETDLSDAAAKAKKASQEIDSASEDITRASSQIEELKTQIKEQEEKKKGLQEQVIELKRQRQDENTLFKNGKLEDEKAIALVEQALGFIKDWKNAKAALIQKAAPTAPEGLLPAPVTAPAKVSSPAQPTHRLAAAAIKVHTSQKTSGKQAPEYQVDAGLAPPPPPPTWENPEYKGAGGEQKGIVGILEIVMDDMKADIKSAEAEEKQAVKDYEKEKEDLEGEIGACDDAIDAYTKDQADKEKTLSDKREERSTKKGELESQIKLYNGYKPGCDFLLVNFEVRVKARQTEVDGLTKAKAILKGAKFGESFLQEMC